MLSGHPIALIQKDIIKTGRNYNVHALPASVCINLVRNPRWGRTQETYGEDPYLLGELGATLTKSVQEVSA